MPRAKSIVMHKHNIEDLREHAARAALDILEPYRVYSPKQRGDKKDSGYTIIHENRTGGRSIVMEHIESRDIAKSFVELLQLAWVQGRRSVLMD